MDPREEALRVCLIGLQRFRDGWATGQWRPFLELLAPSFVQRVPIGPLRGRDVGLEEARRHFRSLTLLGARLQLAEPFRVAASEAGATFELEVSGELYGLPYQNRLALSFDVAEGRITRLREYFGDLDPAILAKGLA
jgi:ketosteroid isomerase-like protein